MNHKQNEEKMPLLRIENLKKYYPIKGGIITHTTGYVKAVDGVSFQICQEGSLWDLKSPQTGRYIIRITILEG